MCSATSASYCTRFIGGVVVSPYLVPWMSIGPRMWSVCIRSMHNRTSLSPLMWSVCVRYMHIWTPLGPLMWSVCIRYMHIWTRLGPLMWSVCIRHMHIRTLLGSTIRAVCIRIMHLGSYPCRLFPHFVFVPCILCRCPSSFLCSTSEAVYAVEISLDHLLSVI